MVSVRILPVTFILWFLTSVTEGSFCDIRQPFSFYPQKYDKVCGLNDFEQLGHIKTTNKQPQKLSQHRESTAFENRILHLEETIQQERRVHADQLQIVQENCQTIQNQIEESNRRLNSFERDIVSMQSENSLLNKKLDSIESGVVSLQSKHSTLNVVLNSTTEKVAVLTLNILTFNEELRSVQNDLKLLKSKYSTMNETLDSFGRDVVTLKSENSSLNERLVSLNGNIKSLQSKQSSLKESFTKQSDSTDTHIKEINMTFQRMQKSLVELQTKYEKERVDASEKFAKMQKKIENGEMIFVGLSFLFVFWVAFSKMRPVLSNPSKDKIPELQSKAAQAEAATERLNKATSIANSKESNICVIYKRKSMDNSIGVVSFSRSGSDVHKKLIESVRSLTKIPVEIRICHSVVTQAEEICKIPPSKMVFVFVDANKRHIILENPDQEIGGFRKQTVEAIQEMGCDVFVVYVRDEAVDDKSLYHHRLTSIQRHRTLASLSDKNRVLSLNTTFSEYQRDFLLKELQNAFDC